MITEKTSMYTAYCAEPPLVIEPGSFKGDSQELARVIQKQVENYPESFDMQSWVSTTGDVIYNRSASWRVNNSRLEQLKAQDGTLCGTTMCIAGYAQLFVDGEITDEVHDRAAELLGLSPESMLFYTGNQTARELLNELVNGTYDDACERRAIEDRRELEYPD